MSSLLLLKYYTSRHVGRKRLKDFLVTPRVEGTLDYTKERIPREIGRF
jgi:hypothetical protein